MIFDKMSISIILGQTYKISKTKLNPTIIAAWIA